MKLIIYNKEKAKIETIDSVNLDIKKHFNRNTKKAFTKEDLDNFWIVEKTKTSKK